MADGSALAGGTAGGSLSIFITSEKERFDTEHLETALEHNMTHWLTVDFKKIKQVKQRISELQDKDISSKLANLIKTPSELFSNVIDNHI
ncbi:MAG TPA: hypothetical protein ENI77_04270 [Nitrospirae bacterium]|mgnify:CR=1 FL=1|nr:hypothetical protein [Nitrospirota bacterium]